MLTFWLLLTCVNEKERKGSSDAWFYYTEFIWKMKIAEFTPWNFDSYTYTDRHPLLTLQKNRPSKREIESPEISKNLWKYKLLKAVNFHIFATVEKKIKLAHVWHDCIITKSGITMITLYGNYFKNNNQSGNTSINRMVTKFKPTMWGLIDHLCLPMNAFCLRNYCSGATFPGCVEAYGWIFKVGNIWSREKVQTH